MSALLLDEEERVELSVLARTCVECEEAERPEDNSIYVEACIGLGPMSL